MQNEKWLFIVNPAAGGGKVGKKWPGIEQQLRTAGVHFDVVFTEKKFHAVFLARQAVQDGFRHLVAVGGDGTGNEVVNGIFQQTVCPPETVTFTMLPAGTGNDWIKTHHIPKSSRLWIKFFLLASTSFQDIGWLQYRENGQEQQRYFLNVAGLSYDAYVAKRADAYKSLVTSTIFYLFLIFRCLFEFKIPRIRLRYDGQTIRERLYTINVGICRYSGGGLQIVPQAIPNDGKLALTFARRISKLEVLLITPFFYLGKIGWHPAVTLTQAEEISVESLEDAPVLVEADGEFLGETPVRMGILKNRLKILEAVS
jgi:YegS/Rv2252/BmrU family lipid kinase